MKKQLLPPTFILVALLSSASAARAADWYVSPQGTAAGQGTRQSPWSLESALSGRKEIKPGDTIYLLKGTYRRRPKEKFQVRLAGTEKQIIHVRPAPGEHAIIDGGLEVLDPSAYLWIWNLEILVSEPDTTKKNPAEAGSHPRDFNRPWGGLHVYTSKKCKFINLVIHDCRQGISLWSEAVDTEVHGCIVYDNGWTGKDRGHGHAIYTQNKDGLCIISDCILTGGRADSLHAYGSSKAYVNNYHIEGMIVYNAGRFLIGGGRPSENITVVRNCLFDSNMQLGYSAPYNVDCEVRDNVIVNGGLNIVRYKKVTKEGNLILNAKEKRPEKPLVVLRPNKYDPDRAHLAVFNWDKKSPARVDLGSFLKLGESFRLIEPRQMFGKAVFSGRYDGKAVDVPVTGEFAAFVVMRSK